MSSTQTEHPLGGSKAAAISNYLVRTMSEYTGRGPTKARTYLSDDVVTVVMKDTLTKGERSLVSDDDADLVLSMRKAFRRRCVMPSSAESRRSSAAGSLRSLATTTPSPMSLSRCSCWRRTVPGPAGDDAHDGVPTCSAAASRDGA